MKIELRQIRYFLVVAEELSFRKAAQRLNMAQPALSRAIQQLEDRLNAPLFTRTSRSVVLTAAGEVFLQGCGAICEQVDALENRVHQTVAGKVGSLVIGYTDIAISGELPALVKAFQAIYPDIHIDLVHDFTFQQTEKLRNGTLDFGFLTLPVNDPQIEHLNVQRDEFVVVMPESHPLAQEDEMELEWLANEPFIIGPDASWNSYNPQMKALCLGAGFLPNVKQEAYNGEGILGLISANMGVTIYASCIANYHRRGIAIKPIAHCDAEIITAMAWNKNDTTPVRQRFIDFVKDLQGE